MPFPQGDVLPPDGGKASVEDYEVSPQELTQKLEALRDWYPEWFRLSDTLGERPIDGMMREMQTNYRMKLEQQKQDANSQGAIVNQIQQNKAVAPEYTQERQQGVPPGYAAPMGKVM